MNVGLRRLRDMKAGLIWILLALYLIDPVSIIYILDNKMAVDLRSFYYAAHAIELGQSPYQLDQLQALSDAAGLNDYVYPYLYPPILAMAFKPLLLFPPQLISSVYLLYNSLALMLCVVLLFGLAQKEIAAIPEKQCLLIAFFAVFMLPLHVNLTMGQINITVLLLLIASFYFCYEKTLPILAGACLAAAVLIKITPLGFIVFFMLDRRYKVIAGFVLTLLSVLGLSLMHSAGPALWQEFLNSLQATAANQTQGLSDKVAIANISLLSVANEVLGKVVGKTQATIAVIIAISAIGLALLNVSIRHIKQHKYLLILPWLCLMLLASPILYTHHLIYLLPGVFLTALVFYDKLNRLQRIAACVFIFIMGLDWPLWNYVLGIHNIAIQSISLQAICLLLISQIIYLYRLDRQHGAQRQP